MNIVLDIILVLILTVVGYVSVIYYLNNIKWNVIDISHLKIKGKNRILYLLSVVIISTILIVLFQTLYWKVTLIQQMKLLTLILIMFPTAVVDFRTQKIPNIFMLAGLFIRCLFYVVEFIVSPYNALTVLKDNLLGVVLIAGFFLLILLLFKNSIGMGDIKLFAIMGLYQGLWGAISSVFCSLIVSFVLSIVLLISRKKERKDAISFAPSILVGTIISIGMSGM